MAYVKTTWQTGDVITAEKLNNAEGGIESAYPLIAVKSEYAANDVSGNYQLDKTYAEVEAALKAGRVVMIQDIASDDSEGVFDFVNYYAFRDGIYGISTVGSKNYFAASADDILTTIEP